MVGVKGKNNFKDRTIILGISGLLVGTSVNLLKYTTKIERPDKSTRNSFPSGHAAIAFMGAEFLRQEYKDVSPWYGIAGYAVATGTGLLRIYNDRHWFGDVVAGAGFGILSTKAAYWLYPMLQRKFSKKKKNRKNLLFIPFYNGQQGVFSLSVKLKKITEMKAIRKKVYKRQHLFPAKWVFILFVSLGVIAGACYWLFISQCGEQDCFYNYYPLPEMFIGGVLGSFVFLILWYDKF